MLFGLVAYSQQHFFSLNVDDQDEPTTGETLMNNMQFVRPFVANISLTSFLLPLAFIFSQEWTQFRGDSFGNIFPRSRPTVSSSSRRMPWKRPTCSATTWRFLTMAHLVCLCLFVPFSNSCYFIPLSNGGYFRPDPSRTRIAARAENTARVGTSIHAHLRKDRRRSRAGGRGQFLRRLDSVCRVRGGRIRLFDSYH